MSLTNFWASSLISTQLLRRAKRGASGKAATKIVMNPNWRTISRYSCIMLLFFPSFLMFPCSSISKFSDLCSFVFFPDASYLEKSLIVDEPVVSVDLGEALSTQVWLQLQSKNNWNEIMTFAIRRRSRLPLSFVKPQKLVFFVRFLHFLWMSVLNNSDCKSVFFFIFSLDESVSTAAVGFGGGVGRGGN